MREEVLNELKYLSEDKYKLFIEKLIPGTTNILGVRIPTLRKIAKRLLKENKENYINIKGNLYFEEIMIQGFIIANIKEDFNLIKSKIETHILKIDNWSLCDSFCAELKLVKKHPEDSITFINECISSSSIYKVRVGLVLLTFHFVNENYIDHIFEVMNKVKNENYYVKMANAWLLSMCYVKCKEKTLNYLQNNNLDDFTYNKGIQKILETSKITQDEKLKLQKIKRFTKKSVNSIN